MDDESSLVARCGYGVVGAIFGLVIGLGTQGLFFADGSWGFVAVVAVASFFLAFRGGMVVVEWLGNLMGWS